LAEATSVAAPPTIARRGATAIFAWGQVGEAGALDIADSAGRNPCDLFITNIDHIEQNNLFI
jgi:hypothetical protein